MIKPDPRAGGCFLSLLIIGGFIAGLALGDPVAGALAGTAVGVLLALAIWLADRNRGGRER
jgi:prepilin signal peptidase PulO-like enzyme (type II secretory pathway)